MKRFVNIDVFSVYIRQTETVFRETPESEIAIVLSIVFIHKCLSHRIQPVHTSISKYFFISCENFAFPRLIKLEPSCILTEILILFHDSFEMAFTISVRRFAAIPHKIGFSANMVIISFIPPSAPLVSSILQLSETSLDSAILSSSGRSDIVILISCITVIFVDYFTIPFSRYSARLVRTVSDARSTATFAMSASVMIFTNCSNEVF